jgi:hypothetical protein
MGAGTIRQNQMSNEPIGTGAFIRICGYDKCKKVFRTDNERAAYHSEQCKKAAQNDRYYRNHRDEIIKRVMKNQPVEVKFAGKLVAKVSPRGADRQFDQDLALIMEELKMSRRGAVHYAVRSLAKKIRENR